MGWQQSTWKIFHLISLKYIDERKDIYNNFFNTFKFILPCEICEQHYRSQLLRTNLNLEKNNNKNDLFRWTVNIHNNVNSMNNKKIMSYEEARKIYENMKLDNIEIKNMILDYVKHNFKKGPKKTENLFIMLESLMHLYPDEEKRLKMIDLYNKMRINRQNIREWLLNFLNIVMM